MRKLLNRTQEFIQYDLWRLPQGKSIKNICYRILQVIILVARGFRDKALNVRAQSLSFTLLFAFVPMVALVYAIGRGFGFEETITEQFSSTVLGEINFVPTLIGWVERYLETARDGLFLGIGLIILIFSVYGFFNMLEKSFNNIWHVKQSRSFGRRLTNYIMVLLFVPVLMVLTSGISIFLNSTTDLAPILLRILPWVVACAVFTWLYIAIPNTKVKFISAIIPGIIVGILFMLVQHFSVNLMMFFTRMNVVYGAFSALPLILVWLQITCTLLMVGADLAFAIQNNAMFAYEQDIKNMSRRYEDYVMLYLLSSIIKRFEQGEVPETLQQMTNKNQLPIRLVSQLLERLEDSNIIRRIYIENEEEQAFVPAMDTRKITVDLVMGQISALGTEEFLQNTPEEMQVFWKRYLELVQSNPTNILVSDLT